MMIVIMMIVNQSNMEYDDYNDDYNDEYEMIIMTR